MLAGVTAKFSPFFSRAISASLRDLEDKLSEGNYNKRSKQTNTYKTKRYQKLLLVQTENVSANICFKLFIRLNNFMRVRCEPKLKRGLD